MAKLSNLLSKLMATKTFAGISVSTCLRHSFAKSVCHIIKIHDILGQIHPLGIKITLEKLALYGCKTTKMTPRFFHRTPLRSLLTGFVACVKITRLILTYGVYVENGITSRMACSDNSMKELTPLIS
jgi:hypothetical protein